MYCPAEADIPQQRRTMHLHDKCHLAEQLELKTWSKILSQPAAGFTDCPKVVKDCPPLDNFSTGQGLRLPVTLTQWFHQLR